MKKKPFGFDDLPLKKREEILKMLRDFRAKFKRDGYEITSVATDTEDVPMLVVKEFPKK